MPVYRTIWPLPPKRTTAVLIPVAYQVVAATGSFALTGLDANLVGTVTAKAGVGGAITSPGVFRKRFPYETRRRPSSAALVGAGINFTFNAASGSFILTGQSVADFTPQARAVRYNCLLRG